MNASRAKRKPRAISVGRGEKNPRSTAAQTRDGSLTRLAIRIGLANKLKNLRVTVTVIYRHPPLRTRTTDYISATATKIHSSGTCGFPTTARYDVFFFFFFVRTKYTANPTRRLMLNRKRVEKSRESTVTTLSVERDSEESSRIVSRTFNRYKLYA